MASTFMVTTPIYYANAPVHLGHAYSSIAADALARWNRLVLGRENVFFLTGLDEHGGNIEKVAKDKGKPPQQLVDEMAEYDREFFDELGVSYDDFIRTTEDRHRVACEAFWGLVERNGDLELGRYEGLYCGPCERYYVEDEVPGRLCPIHRTPVESVSEDVYFFKLSRYTDRLREHYESRAAAGEHFVEADAHRSEMLGLLAEGLRDVSVTRTKITWGIEAPGHPGHVIYVWFDALINYLTALGFPDPKFERFWGAPRGRNARVVHIIGKEINRFHSLLWPAMLMSAGLRLPDRVAVHGFWTVGGEKLSKTLGTGVDPRGLAKEFGVDSIRHFLLREIPFGADGDFSREKFKIRYNADLANDFGNLAHRTIAMSFKYLGGTVKRPAKSPEWEEVLQVRADFGKIKACHDAHPELSLIQAAAFFFCENALVRPQFQDALVGLWDLIKAGNAYLDRRAPWSDKDPASLENTLGQVLVLLESVSWPLLAFLPEKAEELRRRLGVSPTGREMPETFRLAKGDPLFPRIDRKKRA